MLPTRINPRVLFLDDVRGAFDSAESFIRSFVGYSLIDIAKTAEEAIAALSKNNYHVVFLDHDLGGEAFVDSDRKDTGMEVVRYLEKNKTDVSQIVVHSWNIVAAKEMVRRLRLAGYSVMYQPFDSSFEYIV